MIEVLRAAADLQAVCKNQNWKFCFIGGLALLRWGEPRETIDADLSLLTGFSDEEQYVRILLQFFESRVPDPMEFAINNRVLLLKAKSGVGLDIALAAMPYEESMIFRASEFSYPGNARLITCSAEDLIVTKSIAGRGQDWVDVERVIACQSDKLDWNYIHDHLRTLSELKEDPSIPDRVRSLQKSFER